jgi:hypothetical protein
LAEESILTDDFLRELMNVGEVDILVGVPTYNAAATVGQVLQAIRAGLLKYFPRQRAVIINVDGGSKDTTQELVRAASISDVQHTRNPQALRTLHCISTRYEGGPHSGKALYAILAAADLLHPTACSVIASDSGIEPDWIPRLLQPVSHENFDLVTPVYRRHKFDGLLVRNLVYPMIRALYARCVREPYPSELAFSGRLASHFFGRDLWSQGLGFPGMELLLTIDAISDHGFRLAQTFLGTKSNVDHATADLVRAMRNTIGPLFCALDLNPPPQTADSSAQPIPTLCGEAEITLEPRRVNRKRLFEMFAHGVVELEPVLKSILSAATLAELQRVTTASEESCYSNELWAKTVYEFAASYHKAVINRDHIIQALAPLYRGKTHTFLLENRDAGSDEVKQSIEALCQAFERFKPYFSELWNGGK